MKEIIHSLEQIEKTSKNSDVRKTEEAIRTTRKFLSGTKNDVLKKLDGELEVWQTKLSVIFKEPAGREGMARHAKHWVEELRKINV